MSRTAKSKFRAGRRSLGGAFLFLRSNRADGLSASFTVIVGAANDDIGDIVDAIPKVEMYRMAFRRETSHMICDRDLCED
jgi:hypothetical protein